MKQRKDYKIELKMSVASQYIRRKESQYKKIHEQLPVKLQLCWSSIDSEEGTILVTSLFEFCTKYHIIEFNKTYSSLLRFTYELDSVAWLPLYRFNKILSCCHDHPLHYIVHEIFNPDFENLKLFSKPTEIFVLSKIWEKFYLDGNYNLYYQYPIRNRSYYIDTVVVLNSKSLVAIEIDEDGHRDRDKVIDIERKEELKERFRTVLHLDIARFRKDKDVDLESIWSFIKIINKTLVSLKREAIRNNVCSISPIHSIYNQMICDPHSDSCNFPISFDTAKKYIGSNDDIDEPEFVRNVDFISINKGDLIGLINKYSKLNEKQRNTVYLFRREVGEIVGTNFNDVKVEFENEELISKIPKMDNSRFRKKYIRLSKVGFLIYAMTRSKARARQFARIILGED